MNIKFNVKGNGACPMCRKNECLIKSNMSKSINQLNDSSMNEIEIVIYSCPSFEENF